MCSVMKTTKSCYGARTHDRGQKGASKEASPGQNQEGPPMILLILSRSFWNLV